MNFNGKKLNNRFSKFNETIDFLNLMKQNFYNSILFYLFI
jgi:hypothetical protein